MSEPLRRIEERIRPNLRNAVLFGIVALAALIVGHEFNRSNPQLNGYRIASFACAAGVLVFGVAATRSVSRELARAAAHAGQAAVTPLRLIVQIIGYLFTLLAVLDVLDVDLSQFLVGGALTGVIIGIAAQQSLGNFFAGLVLLLARPYRAGDYVTIYSGAINGPHRGRVADVGLLYTSVSTASGPLNVPNSVLLASAVAPSSEPPDPTPEP
ncbi:mechanosensitive ion channel family protein [Jatrophihabitans endophyticus]|uniref:mechanosensitive ion channel family protein n=1 Tax=Jatrophihabitans endophyticus TaxID=1206085 RepID=UPI0019F58B75|nr:mechanosensitive ion channel domain-containing protein [Jatrophihabitans endophyticus]MBE7187496.1 mechanosensitive ion channel [Jatrophihabitans endophyticus]